MPAPRAPGPSGPLLGDVGRLAALLALAWGALQLAGWRMQALVTPWSDLRAYFLPKYQWAAERVAAGELPLWNPLEFGGIPFLATIQPGVFYPPLRVAYLLFSGERAYETLFVLHVAFAAVTTLVLARRLGLAAWPSLFAALWVTQPVWLIQIWDHPVFVWGVSWIPALVLLVRRAVGRPGPAAAAALAVAAALQVTSGYPPYALATAYVLALGVPAWMIEARRRDGRASPAAVAAALGGAMLLAGLLAAAQLLPTLELLGETDRAAESRSMLAGLAELSPGVASLFNFPQPTLAASLAELWARHGPILLGLGLVALARGRRRPAVWWAAGAVVLCAILPRPWYRVLPFYDLVRFGQEWRFTAPLAVWMLAALGLDALLGARRVPAHAAPVATLALVALATAWSWRGVPDYWLRRADLGAAPLPSWAADACGFASADHRAFWPSGQHRGALFRAGIRSAGGYEQSLLPERTARLAETLGVGNGGTTSEWPARLAAAERLASRASLRCVLGGPAPPLVGSAFERVAARRGTVVYRNGAARPRARLAFEVVRAPSADAALALANRAPLDTVVLEGDQVPLPPCAEPGGEVRLTSDRPEEVEIDVTCACPAYLVLADTWFPGWQATVDGVPTVVHRADYAFRAVAVPAGRHVVRFRYAPTSVTAGLALSGLGLALGAGVLVVGRRRPSR